MRLFRRKPRVAQPDPDAVLGPPERSFLDDHVASWVAGKRQTHLIVRHNGEWIWFPKANRNARPGGVWALWRYAQQDPDIIGVADVKLGIKEVPDSE